MSSSNARNHTIDFLKGVCMFLIVTTHFQFTNEERKIGGFSFWIDMAVPVLMVITGFIWSYSYQKRGAVNLQDCYRPSILLGKLVRFLVPYLFAFAAEVLVDLFVFKKYDALYYLNLFFQGGRGPGSYYVPVMIQLVLLVPLLYFLIRKHNHIGLLLGFLITLVFEVAKGAFFINEATYRLLCFRYLFVVGFGCYLFFLKERVKQGYKINQGVYLALGLVSMGIGATYLAYTQYLGGVPVFTKYWTSTSFVASLLICFPCSLLLLFTNIRFLPAEYVGKASYHIFLFQMVFYEYAANYIYQSVSSRPLSFLVCFSSCISAGLLFYELERRPSAALQRRIVEVFRRSAPTSEG